MSKTTAEILPLNESSQDTTGRDTQQAQITITDLDTPISRLSAFTALILQLTIIVILIVFNIVPVWIQKPQSVGGAFFSASSTNALLYLTGTTALATIIASFTTGQIRSLWFSLAVSKANPPGSGQILGRTRTLVGLASCREQSRNFFITASFWLSGLVTTATVAGISATNFPLITGAAAIVTLDRLDGVFCLGILNSTRYAQSNFTWPLGDGSYIGLHTYSNCQSPTILTRVFDAGDAPKGYSYEMGGVPVASLAAGVPYSTDGGFDSSFGLRGTQYGIQYGNQYGDQSDIYYPSNSIKFNWVTQCFPVLAKNPVTCRRIGTVAANGSAISVSAGGCNVSRSFPYLNTTTDAVTAVGICTDNSSSIGSSTIAIGATHNHAFDLNYILNSPDPETRGGGTAAACSVDIVSALGFRLLNFSRNQPQSDGNDFRYGPDQGFSTHITVAANSCTPMSHQGPVNLSQFLAPSMLATGGSASWQLLSENTGIESDGYLITLMKAATMIAWTPGKTFPESHNSLEDVLGQASAIALGMFWGQNSDWVEPLEEEEEDIPMYGLELITNGNVSIEGVRAGHGSKITLLYIIPEVFCAGLLIWLLYCTWHLK